MSDELIAQGREAQVSQLSRSVWEASLSSSGTLSRRSSRCFSPGLPALRARCDCCDCCSRIASPVCRPGCWPGCWPACRPGCCPGCWAACWPRSLAVLRAWSRSGLALPPMSSDLPMITPS
ncbi:hypothetical protein FCI23_35915 [Actinacidiphila oryziradicis]|uniref:Uncharacterized protein n=1 Tax=Actinacidiphila oryziradicis TaxID=2571141 RepID=A0A4U0S8J6_9ACTN|nr:hypothetical protein FCI23_35915 [Actinacidiphila oryziradicis]